MRRLGSRAVIWVRPQSIHLMAGIVRTRRAKRLAKPLEELGLIDAERRGWQNMFYRNRFIIEDSDFPPGEAVSDSDTFRLVEDFVRCGDDYRASMFYQRLLSELENKGTARYKQSTFSSPAELDAFFVEYMAGLVASLREHGVQLDRSPDMPKCYITRDGAIVKGENGRHRLAFARSIGLDRFPLQVFGVHEDWYRQHVGWQANFTLLAGQLAELEAKFR